MIYNKVLLVCLALSTSFAEVALAQGGRFGQGGGQALAQAKDTQDQQGQQQGQQQDQQQDQQQQQQGQQGQQQASKASSAAGAGTPATLNADATQTASDKTGQEPNTDGVKAGQADALTDPANFINFCSGKTLTNGQQTTGGSCNGIPMGDIPSTDNMVSTILTNPLPDVPIDANTDFDVTMQVANLNAGTFTNPTVTYYSAPQKVDPGNKNIVGHVHVTIQSLGPDLKPKQAPNPKLFVFFKGIDDAGDGKGGLKATVTGGLPDGFYRACTMSSSSTHQAVTMPVAQRGAQDDCTKFQVGQGGNAAPGATTELAQPAAATAAPTAQSAAAGNAQTAQGTGQNNQQQATGGRQGRKGQRKQVEWGRRHRFQSRPYVV